MAHIISPYREIEMGQKARVSGHVKIKKVDRGGRTTFESTFDNLILDDFLQKGLSGIPNGPGGRTGQLLLLVGSGAQTTPAPTDTALNNTVGGATSGYTDITGEASSGAHPIVLGATPQDDFRQFTFSFTFDYSEAVGDLTELGIAVRRDFGNTAFTYYTSSPEKFGLITRTLIKDSNGNPVTLTKSGAEKLIVEYELRQYRPSEPTLDVNLNGQDLRLMLTTFARQGGDDPGFNVADDTTWAGDRRGVVNPTLEYLSGSLKYYRDSHASNQNNHHDYWFMLFKTEGTGSTPFLSYTPGGVNDTSNNVFTSHGRVEPDTVDRDVVALDGTFPYTGTADNPSRISLVTSPQYTVSNGMLLFLDPVTNGFKTFTLPAGYRLDVATTFERVR